MTGRQLQALPDDAGQFNGVLSIMGTPRRTKRSSLGANHNLAIDGAKVWNTPFWAKQG